MGPRARARFVGFDQAVRTPPNKGLTVRRLGDVGVEIEAEVGGDVLGQDLALQFRVDAPKVSLRYCWEFG